MMMMNGTLGIVSLLVDAARNLEDVQNWKWNAERQRITVPRVMCDSAIWLVDFNGEGPHGR